MVLTTLYSYVQLVSQCVIIVRLKYISVESAGLKTGNTSGNVATLPAPMLCFLRVTAAFPNSLSHAALPAVMDGATLTVLINSCSSDSFINQ